MASRSSSKKFVPSNIIPLPYKLESVKRKAQVAVPNKT
jgi:hypothetical protein